MNVTKLEVDLNKINHNIEEVKKYTKKDVIPVIKANGYGTYINYVKDFINKFKIVAVANTYEGIELRKNNYKGDILILNQPSIDDLDNITKYNLVVGISSIEFLKALNKKIRVHLEIETGMNRTGIKFDDLDLFINNKYLIIEGMYSHLSSADSDKEYTNNQYELFTYYKACRPGKVCTDEMVYTKSIHGTYKTNILNILQEDNIEINKSHTMDDLPEYEIYMGDSYVKKGYEYYYSISKGTTNKTLNDLLNNLGLDLKKCANPDYDYIGD